MTLVPVRSGSKKASLTYTEYGFFLLVHKKRTTRRPRTGAVVVCERLETIKEFELYATSAEVPKQKKLQNQALPEPL
jgi:hypothetical protein